MPRGTLAYWRFDASGTTARAAAAGPVGTDTVIREPGLLRLDRRHPHRQTALRPQDFMTALA